MGSPPGGRHRLHGYIDTDTGPVELVAAIPAPRAALESPAQWPLDPPTAAIRHVVMPPPYWDEFGDGAVYEPAQEPIPDTWIGRWGFVLGGAVVAVCAAYIVVAGVGGLRNDPAGPANTALTGSRPTATFSVTDVAPQDGSAAPEPTVPAGRSTAGGVSVVAPVAAPVAATTEAAVDVVEQRTEGNTTPGGDTPTPPAGPSPSVTGGPTVPAPTTTGSAPS